MRVPICEIHVMRLGYMISEFYYGLCEVVIVLTLYWRGYVLQNCYLGERREKKKILYDLMLMIKNIMHFIWII